MFKHRDLQMCCMMSVTGDEAHMYNDVCGMK